MNTAKVGRNLQFVHNKNKANYFLA